MNTMETFAMILSIVAILGVALIALPALRKRGIDPDAAIKQVKETAETLKATVEIVKPFLPEHEALDRLDAVFDLVDKGVGAAEQLSIIEKLPPRERKEYARGFVVDSLGILGVEATDEMLKVIDASIESKVLSLGHKANDKPPDAISETA